MAKSHKAYSIIEQITCILMFFTAFFVAAQASPYCIYWSPLFERLVAWCAVILPIITFGSLLFSIISYRNSESPLDKLDWIALGVIFIVQYLIRISMVGTVQLDEGLTCYRSLQELVYHPETLLTNFFEAGKLADRKAYGYIFFALIGEFLVPGNGIGFQWSQMALGIAAACSLFRIFRIMFPNTRLTVSLLAAFVISIQPMFLGLSTLCGLEYGMVVFFIFAFYACVNKKYILMAFWLIVLGSTKSSGLIIALAFLGAFIVGNMVEIIKNKKSPSANVSADKSALSDKSESADKSVTVDKTVQSSSDAAAVSEEDGDVYDWKTGLIAVAAMLAIGLFVYFVVRVCSINGIAFSEDYVKIKLAQLVALNFNWVWYIIVAIGIFMIAANKRVRKTNKVGVVNASILIGCFVVYVLYLLAYPKALLPRYNMMADVLLAILGTIVLLKLFERRRAVITSFVFVGAFMFTQTFVTVDPVSTMVFTNVNTNSFPMVYAAEFASNQAELNGEPGDYGYYNYQYTFVDSAVDKIIADCYVDGTIYIASSAPFCEVQFRQDDLMWNNEAGKRTFAKRRFLYGPGAAVTSSLGIETRSDKTYGYIPVVRYAADGLVKMAELPEHVIYIESPWNHGDSKQAFEILEQYYYHEGPQAVDMGYMGRVLYFNMTLKTSVDK